MDTAAAPRLTDVVRGSTQSQLGMGVSRAVKALISCRGDLMTAENMALMTWPNNREVSALLKSAVNAGSITGSTWGGTLAPNETIIGEFVRASNAASVLGRLSAVHRVPFNVRLARETLSPACAWVGESAPKPVNEGAYDDLTLGVAKIAAITVIAEELARSSDPSAEQLLRNSLVLGIGHYIDRQLFDPSNIAVASTHPGSLTSLVAPISPSGTTAATMAADLTSLIDALVAGGNNELAALTFIASPRIAARLAAKRDTSGGVAFPGVTVGGGSLLGVPLVISASLSWSASGGGQLVLVDQNELLIADDGNVSISLSREASLQMNTAPSAGAATQVSLWQSNLAAIRAERNVNWSVRHNAAAAIAWIDGLAI